jgi:hypothetical protein
MSSQGFIPDSLNKDALRKLLLGAIQEEEIPDYENPESFHALFGHLERGLSTDDVIYALEGEWEIAGTPKFNKVEWQWKYEIVAQAIDGGAITILVAVDTANREFTIITRWRE